MNAMHLGMASDSRDSEAGASRVAESYDKSRGAGRGLPRRTSAAQANQNASSEPSLAEPRTASAIRSNLHDFASQES